MNLRHYILSVLLVLAVASCKKETVARLNTSTPQDPEIENLAINQLQVIGSHNSYRIRMFTPLFNFISFFTNILPLGVSINSLDYDHLSFPDQLDLYGVRHFEIDIYNDPEGGNFYNRYGNKLVRYPVASNIPELLEPGFKVLHIPDIDYLTHYHTFKQSLQAIKDWSDRHPRHVPIFIMVEAKSISTGDVLPLPELTKTIPYDAASADAIDAEIRSIFGNDLEKVITPDDVRGSYSTLREAVLAGNWPILSESRGKIIFVLDGGLMPFYLQGHPFLQNRAMFTFSSPSDDHAAFMILNGPINNFTQIQHLVRQGYIVRTMADDALKQGRTGDYTQMNSAFNSGAQIISTDFYRPDPRHVTDTSWTDYQVIFPGNYTFRVNPVSAADKVELGFIRE